MRGTQTAQTDRLLAICDDLTGRHQERAGIHGTKGLMFGVTCFTSKLSEPGDRNIVSKAMRRAFRHCGSPVGRHAHVPAYSRPMVL